FEAARRVTMVSGPGGVGDDHAPTVACVDGWDRRNPDRILAETPDQQGTVEATCGAIDLFAAVAEAAGPDLTHETFAAAIETLGSVDLAGSAQTRIAGGTLGPLDVAINRWDDGVNEFVVVDSVAVD
ncbi:MAG: hypothetical protein AAFY28_01085, partial [Actinomycetota bacterium]